MNKYPQITLFTKFLTFRQVNQNILVWYVCYRKIELKRIIEMKRKIIKSKKSELILLFGMNVLDLYIDINL